MNDETKRNFFIQMCNLINVTETIVDLASQVTNTFDELMFVTKQDRPI